MGKRGAYQLVHGDLPRQYPLGTFLRFIGPVPANSVKLGTDPMVFGGFKKQINGRRPPRNSGGIPPVSTRFSLLSMEMSRLTRDGTAETVSLDQILRRGRGQGNTHFACSACHEQYYYMSNLITRLIHTLAILVCVTHFPCSADHKQDWQPYTVDPSSCYMCDHTFAPENVVSQDGFGNPVPRRILPCVVLNRDICSR